MQQLKDFYKFEYKRVDYEKTKELLNSLINKLKQATNFQSFLKSFKEIISIQNEIEEMYDYADIRNMRDATDTFFDNEINYWNQLKGKFDSLFLTFYDVILESKYKKQLADFVPEAFFLTIEYQKRIKNSKIDDLLAEEQQLKKEYRSLMGEKLEFNGKIMNISALGKFIKDSDRNIRKKASDAYNDFFFKRKSKLDDIFFNLVNLRRKLAVTLGFNNYKEYSIYKLRRFGYDYEDIRSFRENIRKYIIPIINKLRKIQKENLKIESLEYYDTVFFSEPPKPLYEGEKLIEEYGNSLKDLDNDLYEFYKEMLEKGYIDLVIRDNKVNFSITNYLCKSGVPVITGSYKNTYQDVTVTSHELGHAYQKYNASLMDKNYIISALLKYPTMEIAEMFSHALEIIMLPYIKNLFSEGDYNKYLFQTIYDTINNLSYICLVDEFQEIIYTMIISTKNEYIRYGMSFLKNMV